MDPAGQRLAAQSRSRGGASTRPSGNTANGTRLQIYDCNGTAAQKFSVNGGGTIVGPGGKCVDVAADDTGGNGTAVQLWDCQSYAVDQHWYHNSNGSLETLGRCLDIVGNGTANGTKVELWDCNGVGGQVWQQQSNGSLLNPQSGLLPRLAERRHRQRHPAADLRLQRHRRPEVRAELALS